MIKIAHVMFSYLAQSETFIWQYIRAAKNVYPLVIAKKKENLNQFPILRGKLYSTQGKRLSSNWVIDNWYRRVLKRPLGYAEKIIRKEGVEAIHAHFGPVGCEYLPVVSSLKIPLITSFYGFDLSNNNVIKQWGKNYRKLFETGRQFLVEGPAMKKKLISIGCPKEKIAIQRIAIDLKQYKFKSYSPNSNRTVKILFIGRFVEKKGLEYAIRALAAIRKDFTFEFRVIGVGELEKDLRLLACGLGITEEIKWLGIQPHSKVIEELHNCDIMLQPSVTAKNGDVEGGAPTIILEAQACGVPIISTYHADIPYITKEKDIKSLAENIAYLLKTPKLWPKMGKAGCEHVKKYHNIEKEVVVLEKLYRDTIKKYGYETSQRSQGKKDFVY
jgi:colanic acid/amylovoran biosynthesis glycosyltransferase